MASKFRLGTPLVKTIHRFSSYSALQPINKVISAPKNITSFTEVKKEQKKKTSHTNFSDIRLRISGITKLVEKVNSRRFSLRRPAASDPLGI